MAAPHSSNFASDPRLEPPMQAQAELVRVRGTVLAVWRDHTRRGMQHGRVARRSWTRAAAWVRQQLLTVWIRAVPARGASATILTAHHPAAPLAAFPGDLLAAPPMLFLSPKTIYHISWRFSIENIIMLGSRKCFRDPHREEGEVTPPFPNVHLFASRVDRSTPTRVDTNAYIQ
jgi:hypothetical protein